MYSDYYLITVPRTVTVIPSLKTFILSTLTETVNRMSQCFLSFTTGFIKPRVIPSLKFDRNIFCTYVCAILEQNYKRLLWSLEAEILQFFTFSVSHFTSFLCLSTFAELCDRIKKIALRERVLFFI